MEILLWMFFLGTNLWNKKNKDSEEEASETYYSGKRIEQFQTRALASAIVFVLALCVNWFLPATLVIIDIGMTALLIVTFLSAALNTILMVTTR